MEAGTRHNRVRQPLHLIRPIVILVIIIALLIVGFGPARPAIVEGVNLARDRFATKSTVSPVTWTASSSYSATNGPKMAVDGGANTFWAPQKSANLGRGEWVQMDFNPPIGRLLQISIANGESQQIAAYKAGGRIGILTVTVKDQSGNSTDKTINLTDTQIIQQFSVTGNNIASIRFTIVDPISANDDKPIAMNEINFYQDNSRQPGR
ncbi:discoidin domain-containing protein [Fodinicola feengrottensis]|uniref:discoidin domain-containing protein n=1 Tax=Fodinicola feengrottensis TaxID=435914 RepID=UPI0013D5A388|nr:discoidin domain-containing protein [Fodinicola feengrottensis]